MDKCLAALSRKGDGIMMEDDIRSCQNCGKKYVVFNEGDCYPGGKEKEEIYCPWCRSLEGTQITSGHIRTQKFNDKELGEK